MALPLMASAPCFAVGPPLGFYGASSLGIGKPGDACFYALYGVSLVSL